MLGKLVNLASVVHCLDVTISIGIYPREYIALYCCRLYCGLFLLCGYHCYFFCRICRQKYISSHHKAISDCCKVRTVSVIGVDIYSVNLNLLTYLLDFNAFRYLRTGFAFDVASTLPFQALFFSRKCRDGRIYSLLDMFRLWRLRRVSKFFIW
jgi:hypothetical protein